MPDEKKFSELTTAATLTNDDILALSQMQSGALTSVKATLYAIAIHITKLAQYTSDLQTTDKTVIGAINELKQLISLIPQFSIEVVQALPTEDISDTTIYLVPAEDPETGNYYEEYIHVNDAWELVGTTSVDLSAYYTKLEVDGLLATKANAAEVTAALATKENKTDMPTDVRTIIKDCKTPKNATITNGIAQFECIEENLVKGLKVTMNPIQDLHGYSNPWVGGAGINKLAGLKDGTYEGNGVKAVVKNGVATLSGTTTASGNAIIIPLDKAVTVPNQTCYLHSMNSVQNDSVQPSIEKNGDAPNTAIAFTLTPTNRITEIPQARYGVTVDQVRFYLASGVTLSGTFSPMICLTNTATDFAPYENICPISGRTEASVTRTAGEDVETKTHQYSETIYGGVDDFVNGGATSTMGIVDLGTLDWQYQTQSGNFYADGGIVNRKAQSNAICSQYVKNNVEVTGAANLTTNNRFAFQASVSTRVIIRDTAYTDAETFKTAMDGVQLCYELATPTTISTSAEEINTVAGTNIISGTEPISECKYTELATVDDLIKIIGGAE